MLDVTNIILDALEAFDRETAPLGLYACEEFRMKKTPDPRLRQEWERISTSLSAHGCGVASGQIRNGRRSPFLASAIVHFTLPDGQVATMRMLRTSKIKVRKFGSAYRADAHVKYAERWDELQMDRMLSDLWKPSAVALRRVNMRLLLFIGFASDARPFHQELSQLKEEVDWEQHGARYETRGWTDRYNRGFGVRVSCWTHSTPLLDGLK